MMNEEIKLNQIVTLRDLKDFEEKLLSKIQDLLSSSKSLQNTKQWLRSAELREIMNISPGTLQTLRINGTLPYKKVGGTMFYRYEDVVKLLTSDT